MIGVEEMVGVMDANVRAVEVDMHLAGVMEVDAGVLLVDDWVGDD